MPRHLRDLQALLGRDVSPPDLLTLDETDVILDRMRNAGMLAKHTFSLPFKDKAAPRFDAFLRRLARANPSPILIWNPTVNDCGLLRPIPLLDLRWDFPFGLLPEGLLTIGTSDLRNVMVLDYHLDAAAGEVLEIEISGEDWSDVEY